MSKAQPPRAGSPPARETDLYGPVRDHLVARGFTVRAEVHGCDVTAVRGDELVVVELKRGFTTDLLLQATQRQRVSDLVYVALPRPLSGRGSKRWQGIEHLLRRLDLGLFFVDTRPAREGVEEVFAPRAAAATPSPSRRRNTQRRGALLREIAGRSGDYNAGGSTRRKLVTAYRENAVLIACCLRRAGGAMTPRALRALGTGPKTLSILSRDVYGWFTKTGRGLYGLTEQGRAGLEEFAELASCCDAQVAQLTGDGSV